MNMQELWDEDRRLVILRILDASPDKSLNEDLIIRGMKHLRTGVPGLDVVRGYLTWLEQNGLVRVEKLEVPGHEDRLWSAKATRLGLEVAGGRTYPGVAQWAGG